MSCKVKREVHLEIYADKEGYESWKIGDEIQLVLKGKNLKYGTIQEINKDCLMLNNELGMSERVMFNDIEGYHSLIDKNNIF